jgi:glycosyltransferase involved in cell wall biosynthesis
VINVVRGRRIDRWNPTVRRDVPEVAPAFAPKRRVRLGILIASLQQGGAERASLGLLDALLAAGADVRILTIDRNREMAVAKELTPRIVGLSGSDIRWGTVRKTLVAPWHGLLLLRAVRRFDLSVVLSVMERANIFNLLTSGNHARVLAIRSYPSAMLASKVPLKRFLILRVYGALLDRADRIVVVSREAAAEFAALYPKTKSRIEVIYNACDVMTIARQAYGAAARPGLLRAAGARFGRALDPRQGTRPAARAFAEVARRDPDVRLAIVGKGPLEAELRALCDDLRLTDRVRFLGFQPNPMPWVARARAFVLPSLREGFPNALLEALALGVPVIAADCRSGPREILAPRTNPERKTAGLEVGECGILVPAPDGVKRRANEALSPQEDCLAAAMLRLLEDDVLHERQARHARQRALDFSPERILPQWLRLFEDVAAPLTIGNDS